MLNLWNEVLGKDLKPLTVSSYAYSMLKSPLRFFSKDLELWKDYLIKIASSKFLMGGGINGWKVSFEWAVREQTIRRVLGGYYTLGDRDKPHLKEESASMEHDREENISNPIWKQVCERLKISLGKDVHKSWTGKLEYIEGEANEDGAKLIRLNAPSRFIATTIKDKYMGQVREVFAEMGINNTRLEIEYSPKELIRDQYVH
ncbi:hypothetical protein NOVO_09270 (plasmid) [Rickettsiales bacterium Ac37b]|nr:hypothetical protein NOVO_09270 [Rickettsiales bacterium Ac37b]